MCDYLFCENDLILTQTTLTWKENNRI